MQADVIMSLAGLNGGSWSIKFSPKSAAKLVNDSNLHSGENETGLVSNMAFQQELHGKLSVTGSSSRAVGPGDRVSTLAGKHLACYIVWSEIRWLILGYTITKFSFK
jgi:hypothetical protein